MIDFEKLHLDDMEFDWMIESMFGPGVRHVTNFSDNEIERYREAIRLTSSNLFIDKAYTNGLNKLKELEGFGLYSGNICDISDFWDVFNSLIL